jgi:3-hydroxy-9,10-secoandrosta-1,3,5(10)-triene-9,17-dione monooxygenase reductase component
MTDATVAPAQAGFTARDFRDALGSFATGVTVITTQGPEEPYGMTANAFSSVSLDPPLVLICVIRGTQGEEMIEQNGIFAVNVLAEEQEAISRYFASKSRPRGPDAFAEISHRRAASGAPILDGSAAYLDCRVHAIHQAGDHTIFIGEVMALGVSAESTPLLFHRGQYRYVDTAR